MLKLKKKKKKTEDTSGDGGGKTSDNGGGQKMSLFGVEGNRKKGGGGKRAKKIKPVELRLQKDIEELDGGKIADITFPDPNNLMKINVVVSPEDGLWNGGKYDFTISVPDMYPHKPPVVHCHTKIYHPNIDLEGHVCLNILRADWKPVLDINAVIYGLIYLFYEPNANDPLNKQAAKQLREKPNEFKNSVRQSLMGKSIRIGGSYESFPRMLRQQCRFDGGNETPFLFEKDPKEEIFLSQINIFLYFQREEEYDM